MNERADQFLWDLLRRERRRLPTNETSRRQRRERSQSFINQIRLVRRFVARAQSVRVEMPRDLFNRLLAERRTELDAEKGSWRNFE